MSGIDPGRKTWKLGRANCGRTGLNYHSRYPFRWPGTATVTARCA